MERINYPVTPFDDSLFHISNVLNNFEHARCGKLKTEFHVRLIAHTYRPSFENITDI